MRRNRNHRFFLALFPCSFVRHRVWRWGEGFEIRRRGTIIKSGARGFIPWEAMEILEKIEPRVLALSSLLPIPSILTTVSGKGIENGR